MYVSSFFELHTTLLGWMIYNQVFHLLFETGLLALPFLWIIVSQSARSLGDERGSVNESTMGSIKGLIAAMFVASVCVFPSMTVAPTDVRFQPPDRPDGSTPPEVTAASDPTTFLDHIAPATAPVRIPPWWMLVHSVSAGITHAVIDTLPAFSDIRETKLLLASRQIEDPALGADYRDFYIGCYLPAKRNYEKLEPLGLVPTADDSAGLDWPGSSYLIGMRGGYQPCEGADGHLWCRHAPLPLHLQEKNLQGRVGGNSCGHWWEHLRAGLLEYAQRDRVSTDSVLERLKSRSYNYDTRRKREDVLIRSMLENFHNGQPISGTDDPASGLFERAGELVGTAAMTVPFFVMELLIGTLKQVMPILAAVMLAMTVMFLPFALLFSGFSVGAVLQASFLIFSLIFVQAILAVVAWLDHHLIVSMFADQGMFHYLGSADTLAGDLNKKMIINLVLSTLYLIGPVIWMSVMAAVGVKAAKGANAMFTTQAVVQAVTTSATSAVQAAPGRMVSGSTAGVKGVTAGVQKYRLWKGG